MTEPEAAERRKMISLGREPQGYDHKKEMSPGGATDFFLRREPQSARESAYSSASILPSSLLKSTGLVS